MLVVAVEIEIEIVIAEGREIIVIEEEILEETVEIYEEVIMVVE